MVPRLEARVHHRGSEYPVTWEHTEYHYAYTTWVTVVCEVCGYETPQQWIDPDSALEQFQLHECSSEPMLD